jgi:hypothetical protein
MPERGKDWIEHEVDLGKFQQLEPRKRHICSKGG